MSVNGDVSEQVVRLSLEGFEVLARLTGSGAKNVAAMIYTIMKDKKQTKGKINLNNMIRTGKPLKIFTVSKDDLKTFAREAKNYGISYCALINRNNKDIDGMVDVMVKDEDASRINRIVERFKLTTTDTAKLDTVITKAIEDRDAEKREKGIPEKSKEQQLEDLLAKIKTILKKEKIEDEQDVRQALREEIKKILDEVDNSLKLETTPAVILIVGVNGVGKTTSIGKIANRLKQDGKKVVVAAADTFRAAAVEQLEIWANRAGCDIVKKEEGTDPAAVVYDAIKITKEKKADVLICDTA